MYGRTLKKLQKSNFFRNRALLPVVREYGQNVPFLRCGGQKWRRRESKSGYHIIILFEMCSATSNSPQNTIWDIKITQFGRFLKKSEKNARSRFFGGKMVHFSWSPKRPKWHNLGYRTRVWGVCRDLKESKSDIHVRNKVPKVILVLGNSIMTIHIDYGPLQEILENVPISPPP